MSAILRKFICLRCRREWEVPFGSGRQMVCPKCGSDKIKRTNPGIGGPWRGKGRGFHAGRKH